MINIFIEYKLPDERIIEIADELYKSCKCIFTQSLVDLLETIGISKSIHNSILQCDIDDRRIYHDMKQLLLPITTAIKVISAKKYDAWIGGSIMSSLSN